MVFKLAYLGSEQEDITLNFSRCAHAPSCPHWTTAANAARRVHGMRAATAGVRRQVGGGRRGPVLHAAEVRGVLWALAPRVAGRGEQQTCASWRAAAVTRAHMRRMGRRGYTLVAEATTEVS